MSKGNGNGQNRLEVFVYPSEFRLLRLAAKERKCTVSLLVIEAVQVIAAELRSRTLLPSVPKRGSPSSSPWLEERRFALNLPRNGNPGGE